MFHSDPFRTDLLALHRPPDAQAVLHGDPAHPEISGIVCFYQTQRGVLVAVKASGLPSQGLSDESAFFAFHIHEGGQCSGSEADPFANTLTHYNPGHSPHPDHAGDLPQLLANKGTAFQITLTDRFSVGEIIGKTVLIHARPDDFTTQPSGNAGAKIACGVISKWGKPV